MNRKNGVVMSTVGLQHGRTVLWCIWTILLFTAPSADAGWLDRVRGLTAGSKGISAGTHVVHQASMLHSLTRNVSELTDLFSDMLNAVKKGDAAQVEDIWRDVEKIPGDIVRESFPVLGVVDAAASLAAGAKSRLNAAKRHVERFAQDVVGLDPRSALAISEDERHYFVSRTGILGDQPLPSLTFSTAMQSSADPQWTESRAYDYRAERSTDKRSGSSSFVASMEADDSYESSLNSLEKLWSTSRGEGNERAGAGTNNYQEALDALDRRRSQFAAERYQRIPRHYASDQENTSSPESETVALEHTTEESVESNATLVTSSLAGESDERSNFAQFSPNNDGWYEFYCDYRADGDNQNCRYFSVSKEFFEEQDMDHENFIDEFADNCGEESGEFVYGNSCPDGAGLVCDESHSERKYLILDYFYVSAPYTVEEIRPDFEIHCERKDGSTRILDNQNQVERQDGFLLTCDTLQRGLSVCVEYEYEKEGEFRTARDQCSSSGFDVRLDASCPKGQRASVCQHSSDDSEATTYDYDRMRSTDEFAANCRRTRGRYLGTR